MKRMNFYILGCALVLLILLTASCACCNFKPHSNKVALAKFEGMEHGKGSEDDETLEDEEPIKGFSDEMDEEDDEDEEDVEDDESMMGQIKNGFNGFMGKSNDEEGMMNKLGPNPYSDDTLYDIYGPPTKGSLDCGARSAGLTNSKGPLCLSNKQLNMLKTRGGNASHDAQIGA
jgi:hypothetical protein